MCTRNAPTLIASGVMTLPATTTSWVYIGYLRERLSDRTSQRLIRTLRGAGYTLRVD